MDAKRFTGDGSALTVNGSLSIKDALDQKVDQTTFQNELGEKLDKAGGLITRSLSITENLFLGGNLSVKGANSKNATSHRYFTGQYSTSQYSTIE